MREKHTSYDFKALLLHYIHELLTKLNLNTFQSWFQMIKKRQKHLAGIFQEIKIFLGVKVN